MASNDPFSATDTLDDALLQVIVTRLETRAKNPLFAKMLQDYLNSMGIDGAGRVLDLGCGTGVATRAIAKRYGFSGRVVGVDLSPMLVAAASRIAAEEGCADRVEFKSGDSRKLDLEDGAFDAVIAHTLLSHVDDPRSVLQEMKRLVRPGGMIAVFDGDYASMTFGNANSERGRALDKAVISGVVTSPYVMRLMPRMLKDVGLELTMTLSNVLAEVGRADFWASAIESFRRLVPKSGAMSEEEADNWAKDLLRDSDNRTFFGASNYYSYIAQRPVD